MSTYNRDPREEKLPKWAKALIGNLRLYEATAAEVFLSSRFGLSPEVQDAAQAAQIVQDDFATWGAALAKFESKLANNVPVEAL